MTPDWDRLHHDHNVSGRVLAWWVVGLAVALTTVIAFVLVWMGGAR